ncbi:MAG: RagB/SusD family nutrient uptake outer membrane protein [Rikenellaceae bacterium]|nr:RagB/SusD family nutrient uptake outer membrane protein [Rikenellaceae bacterium]
MKKQIMTLLTASLLLGTSCSSDFLEEKMVSTITQDYFDTEEGLEQLIVGTYDALRWKYSWQEGPYLFHISSDAEIASNTAIDEYMTSAWSASGAMGNTWANDLLGYYGKQLLGGYPIINNCNRAIESITQGKAKGRFATDPAYAAQRLSEAYFNRAWVYYMMVTTFGDVYYNPHSNSSLPAAFNYPRTTSEEIYKHMIADMRYAYDNLPLYTAFSGTEGRERITKGAAAHFLAKLYLQRAQAAEFGQYRNADGSIDNNNPNAYLGMLYKGNVSTDLDSAIFFATQVINMGYSLADDYADLFEQAVGAYPCENNNEIILAASYGPKLANSRYGMRFQCYFNCNYVQALWGLPGKTWTYGNQNVRLRQNDWAYDVFTDKMADSRFEKSFLLEFKALLSTSTTGVDQEYYTYNDSKNTTKTWTAEDAAYFNEHILPTYTRESWGGREAVAGEHKIGKGDLGLVFLENSKQTAIPLAEAKAQPYVLYPRWVVTEDGKYWYRRNGYTDYATNDVGLEKGMGISACISKHNDINREGVGSEYGGRNVTMFRLAETYLIRAEAKGRKGDFPGAIDDINEVRRRAAYKPGEERAEVLARLYPGHETLTAGEKTYPYTVENDKTNAMEIDATYWDGSSAASKAENYPEQANTDLKRFVHFIYNELTREEVGELNLYEGIHHAGIQAERILWHNQMASTLKGHWDAADNVDGVLGQTGDGKGMFNPAIHTFKPFPQTFINMLTDENGKLLDEAGRAAYQNPGY